MTTSARVFCSRLQILFTHQTSSVSLSVMSARRNNTTESCDPQSRHSLAFDDYDAIGFDLDHTLAKYAIPTLFDKVSDGLNQFLVDSKGVDSRILKSFEVDKDFCTRGTVLDIELGNFLKLAEDGTILRASHGTTFLSDAEIIDEYGDDRHWAKFQDLISVVNNFDQYRIFENYFDMPLAVTAARNVDLIDAKNGGRKKGYSYAAGWQDVLAAANDLYNYTQYSKNAGGLFPAWKKDTGKYVEPCSKSLKEWLKKLKEKKKFLFVMTSSYVDYAMDSLDFILGCDWREYFDLFLTFARKPGFFNKERPFLAVDHEKETEAVSELKTGCCYSQGNYKQFMHFLSKETGKEHPKVLYVGDSIRSDIFPAKRYAGWDTLLILEEIVSEQHIIVTSHDEGEPPEKQPRIQEPIKKEKEYLTSSHWGSLFTDKHPVKGNSATISTAGKCCLPTQSKQQEMNTLWGYIIRKYADVAIPQLEYITDLPLDHRLEVFDHKEPFHWGFYPFLPSALKSATAAESKV